MLSYFISPPAWARLFFPDLLWKVNTPEKILYLSFDDGPHPEATPYVLDLLKARNAKATFFCIGKNVLAHPEIYNRIIEEGHAVGNHTQHHLNGWRVSNMEYYNDIKLAAQVISSPLFRPPYGKMKLSQIKGIKKIPGFDQMKIVMWDVLSGDFDPKISPRQCFHHVTKYSRPGSIIVFHDSKKAFSNMSYCLPKLLDYYTERGYRFQALR